MEVTMEPTLKDRPQKAGKVMAISLDRALSLTWKSLAGGLQSAKLAKARRSSKGVFVPFSPLFLGIRPLQRAIEPPQMALLWGMVPFRPISLHINSPSL